MSDLMIHKANVGNAGAAIRVETRHDGSLRFHYAGGGFQHMVPANEAEAFLADHVAFVTSASKWVKTRFEIDEDESGASFEGWTDGSRWNGWAVPRVTAETLPEVVAILDGVTMNLIDDGTGCIMLHVCCEWEEEGDAADPVSPEWCDDAGENVYDVGLGFIWVEVEPGLLDWNVGDRVRLRQEFDLAYPYFKVPAGAEGTVVRADEGGHGEVSVLMDEHIDGCEEWENHINLLPEDLDELTREECDAMWEVIERA